MLESVWPRGIIALGMCERTNRGLRVQHPSLNLRHLEEHANSEDKYPDPRQAFSVQARAIFAPTIAPLRSRKRLGSRVHIRQQLKVPALTNPVMSANTPVHNNNLTRYTDQLIQIILELAKNLKK